MDEQKQNYYVVMVELAFLGLHVEAESEEEAREKARAFFDEVPDGLVGIEAGIRDMRVHLVEEDDETSGSVILKLLC